MTYWYPGVAASARIARQEHPGVPQILGGSYAALASRHAAQLPGIDALVPHRSLPATLSALCRHLQLSPPTRSETSALVPDWDLTGPAPHAALLTSWGCPFRCPYCATPSTHGGWQPRPLATILKELQRIATRPAVRHLALYDDALLYRRNRHFLPWSRAAVAAGLGRERFRWHLPNAVHPRWIDRAVAASFRDLGVASLWLGIDSFDSQFHRTTSGKLRPGDLQRALAALDAERAHPRLLGAYLLAGLPGQSPETVHRSIAEAQRYGLRVAIASYSPVPGTPHFRQACGAEPRLAEDPIWQNNTLREMLKPELFARLRAEARRAVRSDGMIDMLQ
jgi:radical SAM superfamily enzyme YgiQ (UPF0313 family)